MNSYVIIVVSSWRNTLTLINYTNIVSAGISSLSLGVLKPGRTLYVSVSLLPIQLGLQKISGFELSSNEAGIRTVFTEKDLKQQVLVLSAE